MREMGDIGQLAALVAVVFFLLSVGYNWAKDDDFTAFISECNSNGVVRRVIDGETLHVNCRQIEMTREWVKK